MLVGAHGYDDGQYNEGACFVFYGSINGVSNNNFTIIQIDHFTCLFGHQVSSAGDVNGDGFSDIIVSSSYYDNGEYNEGDYFSPSGSHNGISKSPSVILETNKSESLCC